MNAKQQDSQAVTNVKPIIRCMEGNHVFKDTEKPCDCRKMISLRKAMETPVPKSIDLENYTCESCGNKFRIGVMHDCFGGSAA